MADATINSNALFMESSEDLALRRSEVSLGI
jgi:hypothetical protein